MSATPENKPKFVARLEQLEKDRAYFTAKKNDAKLAVVERKIAEVKALIEKCDAKAAPAT